MWTCKLLDLWRGWLDSLDSGGGQSFLLIVLIVLGIGVYKFIDPTAGGQIITLSFGAYLAKITHRGTNKDQLGTTTTIAATTHTDPPLPSPPVAPVVPPSA